MICEAYFIEPSKTASSMHQLAMHGLLQHIKQTSDRDASIWHRLMLCAKDIKILAKSICDKTSSSIYLQYQLETCYIIIRGLLWCMHATVDDDIKAFDNSRLTVDARVCWQWRLLADIVCAIMARKTDDRPLHIKTQQILRSYDSMSDIDDSVVELAQII